MSARNRCECKMSKWPSRSKRTSRASAKGSNRLCDLSTCTAPSNSGARRAVSNAPSPMPTTASNTDQLEGGYAARGGGVDLTAAVRQRREMGRFATQAHLETLRAGCGVEGEQAATQVD